MELSQKTLHQLCGIANIPALPEKKWSAATLRFIGGDGYVLGTKRSEVRLGSHAKGFCLTTNGQWSIAANSLLGTKVTQGRLYDVEVVTEVVTLHLANLMPGRYPIVLRTGETVKLN